MGVLGETTHSDYSTEANSLEVQIALMGETRPTLPAAYRLWPTVRSSVYNKTRLHPLRKHLTLPN